jgi:hypothetical protein
VGEFGRYEGNAMRPSNSRALGQGLFRRGSLDDRFERVTLRFYSDVAIVLKHVF